MSFYRLIIKKSSKFMPKALNLEDSLFMLILDRMAWMLGENQAVLLKISIRKIMDPGASAENEIAQNRFD